MDIRFIKPRKLPPKWCCREGWEITWPSCCHTVYRVGFYCASGNPASRCVMWPVNPSATNSLGNVDIHVKR